MSRTQPGPIKNSAISASAASAHPGTSSPGSRKKAASRPGATHFPPLSRASASAAVTHCKRFLPDTASRHSVRSAPSRQHQASAGRMARRAVARRQFSGRGFRMGSR